jgi:hypothetical protein
VSDLFQTNRNESIIVLDARLAAAAGCHEGHCN